MKPFIFKAIFFFSLNILALLIFFSWINDAGRVYWDIIDYYAAGFLNGLLTQSSSVWNGLWGLLSMRIADLLPLIFIAAFFYFDDVLFAKQQRLAGMVGFVTLLALLLLVRESVDFYVDYYALNRVSPSLQLDSIIRLSEIYPNLNLKDASAESFPGDHAAVLITWLGYSLFFVRNRWSWAALLVVVVFSLPRLISGAHWLSDVLVGGVGIALIALAFGLYTPLLNTINQIGHRWVLYFLKLFGKNNQQ